jgi:hypothetical protein
MKAKPNTDQFKIKRDPSAFLEGGAADIADRLEKPKQSVVAIKEPVPAPEVVTKVHREQKVFRLPLDLINALKRESYERSMKTGSRVTETELVEQSLREFLNR